MRFLLTLLVALVAGGSAFAADAGNAITVERPSSMINAGVPVAPVFMVITNNGKTDDALVSATTPVGKADLHTIAVDDKGMMSSIKQDSIKIPAGQKITFSALGDHIIITDLNKTMKAGDQFPLTLAFAKAGAKDVGVKVVDPAGMIKLFPIDPNNSNFKKISAIAQKKAALKSSPRQSWSDMIKQKFSKGNAVRPVPSGMPATDAAEKAAAQAVTPPAATPAQTVPPAGGVAPAALVETKAGAEKADPAASAAKTDPAAPVMDNPDDYAPPPPPPAPPPASAPAATGKK